MPTAQEAQRLPKQHQATVWRQMSAAYAMRDYEDARCALERLLRELMHLNPSAARSLEEGMEETLTIHRLGLPELQLVVQRWII